MKNLSQVIEQAAEKIHLTVIANNHHEVDQKVRSELLDFGHLLGMSIPEEDLTKTILACKKIVVMGDEYETEVAQLSGVLAALCDKYYVESKTLWTSHWFYFAWAVSCGLVWGMKLDPPIWVKVAMFLGLWVILIKFCILLNRDINRKK